MQPLEVTKLPSLNLANSVVEYKVYQSLDKFNDFNRSILKKTCKVGVYNAFAVCAAYYNGIWCIVYATSEGEIKIVDFNGKKVAKIKNYNFQLSVNSLCTINAHNTLYVVLGCDDGSVRIVDVRTHKEVAQCNGHTDEIYSVCTECIEDRWYIVSGSHDATVRIWGFGVHGNEEQAVQCKEIVQYQGHTDAVSSVCTVCVEGKWYIISGSDDASVRIWDFNLEPVKTESTECRGHTGGVNSVCTVCIKDVWYIISGSDDATIRVWDFQGNEVGSYKGEEPIDFAFAACIEGEPYIISCSGYTLNVYDFHGDKILNYKEKGNDFSSVCITYINHELYILVGASFTVSVYDFFTMIRKIKNLSYDGCEKVLALLKNKDHSTVAQQQQLYTQLKLFEDNNNTNNSKKRTFDEIE